MIIAMKATMIALVIAMIRNLIPESFMVMLQDLIMLIMTYMTSKNILVIFHNASNYICFFIVKQVSEEFAGQFEYLEKKWKIQNLLSTNKKARKWEDHIIQNKTHQASFLLSLTDNLAEGLHKGKYNGRTSSHEYITANNGLLTFKCVDCKKTYEKNFNKDLSKISECTHQFCDGDINKCWIMFQKAVYPYEYINGWERFSETPLPTKKQFCSNLTMESIIDADYKNVKRVCKNFWLQNLGQYHNLLLAKVFESFKNKCLEINELDPVFSFQHLDWHGRHVWRKKKLNWNC